MSLRHLHRKQVAVSSSARAFFLPFHSLLFGGGGGRGTGRDGTRREGDVEVTRSGWKGDENEIGRVGEDEDGTGREWNQEKTGQGEGTGSGQEGK